MHFPVFKAFEYTIYNRTLPVSLSCAGQSALGSIAQHSIHTASQELSSSVLFYLEEAESQLK